MVMYDTIHIWLPNDRVGVKSLLYYAPQFFSDTTEHHKDDGNTYVTGTVGSNYRAIVNDLGLSLQGSLAKYFLNDNFHTLTRSGCQQAIQMIADELHLPIDQAIVKRIDIAQNLTMQYAPETYYPYLADCPYYKRLTYQNSIAYKNGLRYKTFYNKIAEGNKKGVAIPEIWQGASLLRYELRFTSRLPDQLNLNEIPASILYNERFYMGLVKRWAKEYEAINKLHLINFNLSEMNSPKDFFRQLALLKIKEMGQSNAMQLVEDLRAKNAFANSEYYSRLKRDIKNLCKEARLTTCSELVAELDKKVKAATEIY